ncbi:hypothetical protein AAVH_20813 [Aphelenchoides avenae]|nr:hypothetical protein AAVH_20813 [Aphelenchus avenae]
MTRSLYIIALFASADASTDQLRVTGRLYCPRKAIEHRLYDVELVYKKRELDNAHHISENGTFTLDRLIPLNEVDRQRFPLVRIHGVCPGLADGVKEVAVHALKGNIDLGVLNLSTPKTAN